MYNQDDIKVVSSNTQRTIQSAQALLLGLYPPPKRAQTLLSSLQSIAAMPPLNLSFSPDLSYQTALPFGLQPIPIFVNYKHKDLILVPETCPAFKAHQSRLKASPAYA